MTTVRLRPPDNRVSPRAVWMWTVSEAVRSVVLTGALAAGAWAVGFFGWFWVPDRVVDNIWLVPVAVGALLLVRTLVAPSWRYRVHRWEITGDVVYIREGWISRSWQLVPISRIQTVDHTQGWLERAFDLATLKVQTASFAGSSTIEGLAEPQARRISEELAARAGELRDDAT
ncbi:PH domain-containing protein [Thermobifida halotolerans]|uniref:PH domain-containing protein n=1 Tax=Thermobifida halotolerans TaxID=483545 RepID=UPI001F259684|nr:PH domain-containing protein [Thermobifida halotolerans]